MTSRSIQHGAAEWCAFTGGATMVSLGVVGQSTDTDHTATSKTHRAIW